MSQPHNFGPNEKDPLAVLLKSSDQLIALFQDAARPRGQELMGIEYEMFGRDKVLKKPLPYEGRTSITSLFLHLAAKSDEKDPWVPAMEGHNIVALTSARGTIALEPGGQVEIAMGPASGLLQGNADFLDILQELQTRADELGIELFAVGIHPSARPEDMAQVKKKRYAIMRNYMSKRQGLGIDMMTRTCSIQLNLDYNDEPDLVEKARLGVSLMPFLALLCSSSAFKEGKTVPHAVERAYVWQNTDTDRTGFPAIIFEDDFGYKKWIEWALDVPMYFIRRGPVYIDATGASFRDFMANGFQGEHALVRDFVDHLTTIFSEVRLKPYLELRSCDSLPGIYVVALSSLCWALFYNEQAQKEAMALLAHMTHKELVSLHEEVVKNGRSATFRGQPVFKIVESLLSIAEKALIPLQAAHFLKPFNNLVQHNTTITEYIKDRFPKLDHHTMDELVRLLAPMAKPLV